MSGSSVQRCGVETIGDGVVAASGGGGRLASASNKTEASNAETRKRALWGRQGKIKKGPKKEKREWTLLGAPGIATRSKDASRLEAVAPRVEAIAFRERN